MRKEKEQSTVYEDPFGEWAGTTKTIFGFVLPINLSIIVLVSVFYFGLVGWHLVYCLPCLFFTVFFIVETKEL